MDPLETGEAKVDVWVFDTFLYNFQHLYYEAVRILS